MSESNAVACPNCHKSAHLYPFKVMVVQRTKTVTHNMLMCVDCARQLCDVLYAASDMKTETLHAV